MPWLTSRRGAVALLLLAVCGCARPSGPDAGSGSAVPSGPASAGPSRTGAAPTNVPALEGPITLVRTGGLAGVRQSVVVQPDGSWRRTERVGGTSGRMTGAQLAQLRQLAGDPRLAAEAGRTATPTRCADAFGAALTVYRRTVRYVDCPADADQPAAAARIVALLLRLTG